MPSRARIYSALVKWAPGTWGNLPFETPAYPKAPKASLVLLVEDLPPNRFQIETCEPNRILKFVLYCHPTGDCPSRLEIHVIPTGAYTIHEVVPLSAPRHQRISGDLPPWNVPISRVRIWDTQGG